MSYLKSVFSLTVLLFFSYNLSAQLADVDEGCAPLNVNFSAPAGATGFSWDFGGLGTSNLQNPTQSFPDPGTFIITFTDGVTTTTDTVFVYEKPSVDFEADTLIGCVPFDVNFSSTSAIDPRIDISSYSWTFGDGTSGTGENIAHTYNIPGSFQVGLELFSSMPGCGSFGNKEDFIVVNPSPDIKISASNTSACDPPLNVTFSNTTPNEPNYTYFWDFGNSETSTERIPPTVTYDAAGTYNANLTVTDDKGCSKDSTIIINIGSPFVDILIGDTICASPIPQAVRNGSSNGDYQWTFSSPASPTFSPLRQPNVFFREEGFYDITLTVTDPDEGCSTTETVRVYAEVPSTDFTIDPSYTCDYPVDVVFTPTSSDIVGLDWTIYDASLDSTYMTIDSIATYGILRDTSVYGLNGLREIETTLRITNARGCIGFETKKDTFFAPNARFNTDTIMGCAPLEVTFYDSMSVSNEAIVSYEYEWGDGTPNTTLSTNDSVKHVFTQPGEYDVILYISNAANPECIDTSYAVTIFVGDAVTADFTVDKTTICPGDSIQFMGTGDTTLIDAWHFDTDGSRMSHCADDRNPTWDFESMTGAMDVTMTVLYNGCATTVEKQDLITVQGPIAQLDYLNDCDNKFEVVFADSSHDATLISWDFGDGSASSTVANPSHRYDETGDYQVILTASNPSTGCPDSRDTTMVHIRNLKASFELEDNYCQGEMIMFDASSSTDVNNTCWKGFTWFPSDSRPITTEDEMIDYSWTGIDTQTLELIVQDINGCQDTLRDTTTVWQVNGEIEADPTKICAPNEVNFTDLSTGNGTISRWEWDFGDMRGTSTEQNPTYQYTTTPTDLGFYTVNFIVFDSLECSDTITTEIEFYVPRSEILLSDDAICVGDEITYNATDFTDEGSFLNFKWFLNGDSISNVQSGSITFENDKIGDNTLRLEYTEAATGCTGITEVIINVQDYPDPTFTSPIDDNTVNCAGQNVTFTAADNTPGLTYSWDFEGTGTVFPVGAVGEFNYNRGDYTVTLFVESSNGCSANSSKDYTFVQPEGTLTTGNTTICLGDTVVFELTNAVDVSTYAIFIEGNSFENASPLSYTFDEPGSFPVILRTDLELDDRTCSATDTLSINVLDADLKLDASNTDLCSGEFTTISLVDPDPAWQLTWSPINSGDTSITVNPTTNTRYEVRINGATGACSDRAFIDINVAPTSEIKGDTIYTMVKAPAPGETFSVTLSSLPEELSGFDINWNPTDLNNSDNILQPTIDDLGETSAEYTATVSSVTDGGRTCYSEVFSRIISPAIIPNIFSPNNDMINDFFQVFINEDDAEVNPEDIESFQVFNRWGQLVYNNETPTTGWNGRFNGEEAISDVYIYKIIFRNPDGTLSEPCEGDVTLYR